MFSDSDLFSASMDGYFDDPYSGTFYIPEDFHFPEVDFFEFDHNQPPATNQESTYDFDTRKKQGITRSGHKRCPSAPLPVRVQQKDTLSLLAGPLVPNKVPARPRQNSLPANQTAPECLDQEDFDTLCLDDQVTFNPAQLGFLPRHYWKDEEMTFGDLVKNYFRKKTSSNCRFIHKLFNALKVSSQDSFYSKFVGVVWLNDKIFKVDKYAFARLLGIKAVDGSLFHKQGNFPSHGFIELTQYNIREFLSFQDISDVDYDSIKVLMHPSNTFTQMSVGDSFEDCNWISTRPQRH